MEQKGNKSIYKGKNSKGNVAITAVLSRSNEGESHVDSAVVTSDFGVLTIDRLHKESKTFRVQGFERLMFYGKMEFKNGEIFQGLFHLGSNSSLEERVIAKLIKEKWTFIKGKCSREPDRNSPFGWSLRKRLPFHDKFLMGEVFVCKGRRRDWKKNSKTFAPHQVLSCICTLKVCVWFLTWLHLPLSRNFNRSRDK